MRESWEGLAKLRNAANNKMHSAIKSPKSQHNPAGTLNTPQQEEVHQPAEHKVSLLDSCKMVQL